MRILVAGASGYIGTELVAQLEADGHELTLLTRGEPLEPRQKRWNPGAGELDPTIVESADAVVNFSGASISKLPWTKSYQREILSSRLDATHTITAALNSAGSTATLLNASAVGFYGDRAAEKLTEEAPKGTGYLSDVTAEWEAAAHEAPARVVTFRTGIVVGRGGAFGPLELLTRFGLASRLGSGDQFWPWISLFDEAAAIRALLTSQIEGAVNLAGPEPATAVGITRLLAKAMGKPHLLAVPRTVIELALGTAGRELLLASQEMVPQKLLADGFTFRHETVESAIGSVWSD